MGSSAVAAAVAGAGAAVTAAALCAAGLSSCYIVEIHKTQHASHIMDWIEVLDTT